MPSSPGPIKSIHFLLSAFYNHYNFQCIFRGPNSVLQYFKAICQLRYSVEACILVPVLSGLVIIFQNEPKTFFPFFLKHVLGFFHSQDLRTFKTFFLIAKFYIISQQIGKNMERHFKKICIIFTAKSGLIILWMITTSVTS